MSRKLLQPELTTATGVRPSSVKSASYVLSDAVLYNCSNSCLAYLIYPLTLLPRGERPLFTLANAAIQV
jgi:hypothetical protein